MRDIQTLLPIEAEARESSLAHSAFEALAQLDLSKIRNAGIWRHRDTYFLNIAYPSLQAMGEVNDSTVYASSERTTNTPGRVGLYVHIPYCTAECEESMRRTIMLGMKIGMDRNLFMRTYGVDVHQAFQPIWNRLQELGLVEITDQDITLTYSEKLFADEVGQQFYSEEMKRRMSVIDPHLVSTTWPQFNV